MESQGFKEETTIVVFGDHGYQVRIEWGCELTCTRPLECC